MGYKLFTLALCGLAFLSLVFGQVDLQTPVLHGFPFNTPKSKENVPTLPSETTSNSSNDIANDLSQPWRLSRDIIPNLYKLQIIPILDADQPVGDQWTVPGVLAIEVTVNVTTQNVTIHRSADLSISSVKVVNQAGEEIAVTSFDKYNADYQFLHIELERELVNGENYTMAFEFISQIHTELHGLYKSEYLDPISNQPKWIGVSQMEAINARELFPCFDEPYFKAIFEVKIGKRHNQTVLCNSKSTGIKLMPGIPDWEFEEFESTPRMSTYLFATVISDFKFAKSSGDVLPQTEVRTYAPEHYISQGRGNYSAEMGAIILDHFANYFKQEYPMNKMDLAGVPAFYFGAMENFGLNIYRESLLLYFEQEDTEAERQAITEVLAHELAHQWHGNRVSPAWWTHIWLNEGFADFLQHLGMEEAVPEFRPWDKITLTSQKVALSVDSNKDFSHPLKIEEDKWITKDPMDWFDQLTYQKGGSLIYMMEGFLTREVLQQGLQNYHERMQFQAAEQDFLFEDLNVVATQNEKIPVGLTMKAIMDTWTLQPGYPLLRLSLNTDKTQVTISQTKYGDEASEAQWIVPISLATESKPDLSFEPELWLQTKEASVDIQPDDWIIANAGGSGYYRIAYDEELEKRIAAKLTSTHDAIDYRSRSELVDDYFSFAWDKIKPIESALEFTKYLGETAETEYIVWSVVLHHLRKPMNLFSSDLDDLKAYIIPRIVKAVEATGGISAITPSHKGQDVLRHTLLLDWLCGLGETSCLGYSAGLVDSWKNGESIKTNPVPKDLRPIVYCASVAASADDGSTSAFDFIYELYTTGNEDQGITTKQRNILLKSLACAQEPTLVDSLLQGTLQPDYYRSKAEAIQVLGYLGANTNARGLLFNFIEAHYDELVSYFGNTEPIEGTIATLSSFIGNQEELNQMEKFIDGHDELSGFFEKYRLLIQENISWMEEFGQPMRRFFQVSNPETTTTEATTTKATTPEEADKTTTEEIVTEDPVTTTESTSDSSHTPSIASLMNIILLCAAATLLV